MRTLRGFLFALFLIVFIASPSSTGITIDDFENFNAEEKNRCINLLKASAGDKISEYYGGPSFSLPPAESVGTPSPPESFFSVAGIYPYPGQKFENEIVIFFSEEIDPLSLPDAEPACMLIPNISGRIQLEKNCLKFSSPFLKALCENALIDSITLNLNPLLKSTGGKILNPADYSHVFPSRPLGINWILFEKIAPDSLLLKAGMNHKVNASLLKDFISVVDAVGNAVPVSIELAPDAKPDKSFVFSLPITTPLPISLILREGIPLEISGKSVSRLTSTYPNGRFLSPPKISFNNVESPELVVSFKNQVSETVLADMIQLKEDSSGTAISLSYKEKSGNTLKYAMTLKDPASIPTSINIQIPAFLPSADKTTVLRDKFESTILLHAPDSESEDISPEEEEEADQSSSTRSLAMDYHYWNDNDMDGYSLFLSLNVTCTAENLKDHIVITPPVENMVIEALNGFNSHTFKLGGTWKSKTSYTLRISAGMEYNGADSPLKNNLSFPLEETPFVSGAAFDSPKQIYFIKRDSVAPILKGRNLNKATVSVHQVFPSNIPLFVKSLSADSYYSVDSTSLAGKMQEYQVQFPEVSDTIHSIPLDLSGILPENKRGVFILSVSPSLEYESSTRPLIFTDMGALAHWTNSELVLFVHNLNDLEPVINAQVTIYSDKYQLMGTLASDQAGMARFGNFNAYLGVPALALIESGDDYTFLDLREEQELRTPFTPDMPDYDRDGYDAFIYFDRNLYRPGETVHIRWITRTRYVDALPDVPLQLQIANPKGVHIQELPITLSALGTGNYDFTSERTHATGKYTVTLCVPGSKKPIGTAYFNLEEFVPNRMSAKATLNKDRLVPGDSTTLTVLAENLYGGPAAGRKTEGRVFLNPITFKSERFPDYVFGNDDSIQDNLIKLGESVTDENGVSTFDYQFVPPDNATMPFEAIVAGRVLELGGRAVTDSVKVTAFPDSCLLGITATPVPEREVIVVNVIALNPDESPSSLDSVTLTLEKRSWNYYLRQFNGRNNPQWKHHFSKITSENIPLTEGKGIIEIPYPDSGTYRFRVHSPKTRLFSALTFSRWWKDISLEESSSPELIKLTINKELYLPGDRLELKIDSPYDGKAFVVVQGEGFLDSCVIPINNGSGNAILTVSHTWFPNAWIQATVVKSATDSRSAQYPYSSHAILNVPMDDPARKISTSIAGLPQEMRPKAPLSFSVETKDATGNPVSAEVTVAAVDEGIHSILGYENPDPYAYFQRSRKFIINQSHYYDKIYYDAKTSPVGGDMMRRLGLANQVDENWIRPVALWTGTLHTDSSGIVACSLDIPEFTGQLRIVAVAANSTSSGTGATSIFVRRPYLLQTSLPRFVLSGDAFQCTTAARNLTDSPVSANISWTASGVISGAGEKRFDLKPNGEHSFLIPFVSDFKTGQSSIDFTMTVLTPEGAEIETISNSHPLPVRPPAAYQSECVFGIIEPGEERLLENTTFIESPDLHSNVRITRDPFIRLRPALRHLLQYPYGCVEQTTSKAMPLLVLEKYASFYQDYLQDGISGEEMAVTAETLLNASINRLFSMQTTGGGLGYWPGSPAGYPYGSVYALHFLTIARRNEKLTVDETSFRTLQKYVLDIMKEETSSSSTNNYLRAYACYVLALDNQIDALNFIPVMDTLPLSESARYLLAAAKCLYMNTSSEEILRYLDESPIIKDDTREYSGNLNSSVRSESIRLISLIQMNVKPESQLALANSLSQYLSDTRYLTTQDSAFAVTALAMMFEKNMNGGTVSPFVVKDAEGEHIVQNLDLFSRELSGSPPRYTISNDGTSPVFYYQELSGIPKVPKHEPEDHGMVASRKIMNENGSIHVGNTFTHGAQYLVILTIKPDINVEHLIVTDMLPAGFEIVNPRIETLNSAESASQDGPRAITPDYLEIRDDRLAFSVAQMSANSHTFRYLVRAVTPGKFQVPALHAECMYSPEICSTSTPWEITIE